MQQQDRQGGFSGLIERMLPRDRGRVAFAVRAGLIACFAAIVLVSIAIGSFLARSGDGVTIDRGSSMQAGSSGVTSKDSARSEKGGASSDEESSGAGSADNSRGARNSGDSPGTSTEKLYIDIDGAVTNPGVYELAAGSRVSDAIDAAGGLAADADTAKINRAAVLSDGIKVRIPRVGEVLDGSVDGLGDAGASGSLDTTGGAAASASPSGAIGGTGSGLVNINTASAAELDELPGIGPSTAEAIIKDREQLGSFASTEDLMRVSGIGEKKFEKIKDLICV